MESLATKLRSVIAQHVQGATSAELLAIASTLAANETPVIQGAGPAAWSSSEPLVKIGKSGEQLEKSATDWDAVLDTRTGLIWSRRYAGPRAAWSKALEQPKALSLAGYSDWQVPSIRQLFSIVDHERAQPSIDTDYFHVESKDSDWCWTRTPWKASPGDYAWGVYFYDGRAYWYYQHYEGFVRAVRASQALDYWLH